MKRKLFTLGVCLVLALGLILLMKSRNRVRHAVIVPPASSASIITQDGKLTVVPPETFANATIVGELGGSNEQRTTNQIPAR